MQQAHPCRGPCSGQYADLEPDCEPHAGAFVLLAMPQSGVPAGNRRELVSNRKLPCTLDAPLARALSLTIKPDAPSAP